MASQEGCLLLDFLFHIVSLSFFRILTLAYPIKSFSLLMQDFGSSTLEAFECTPENELLAARVMREAVSEIFGKEMRMKRFACENHSIQQSKSQSKIIRYQQKICPLC